MSQGEAVIVVLAVLLVLGTQLLAWGDGPPPSGGAT